MVHDGVAASVAGDVFLSVWKEPASFERWSWQADRIDELARGQAEGIVVVSVILPTSDPPDAKLRKRILSDFQRWGPGLRKYIGVPIGDTVWASVVRAIMRTVLLVAGYSERLAVAGDVREAVALVRRNARAKTPSAGELRDAIDRAMAALAGTPASPLHSERGALIGIPRDRFVVAPIPAARDEAQSKARRRDLLLLQAQSGPAPASPSQIVPATRLHAPETHSNAS